MPLTADDTCRYQRHLLLPEVGPAGQERLQRARVLLVGIGGLGSPVALYLAAAGIGTLGIMDPDVVEVSNLQRQVLHTTPGVGASKALSAEAHLRALNPSVRVDALVRRLQQDNARETLRDYHVVVDGTDNFASRYLLNETCVRLGKPLVFGSVLRYEGQASVFDARCGPCYSCLYPDPLSPEAAANRGGGGLLGVVPGLVGLVQATETLKLLLGIGEPLIGRLLIIDTLAMRLREVRLAKNPDCPVCGHPERE